SPRSRRPIWPFAIGVMVVTGMAIYVAARARVRAADVGPIRPVMLTPAEGAATTFNASGATFPYPFYAKLFAEYNGLRPNVRINYSSVGSGQGIRQICDLASDFGASDAPMTDEQMRQAKGGQIMHIPMTLGAVVPIYNVPGLPKDRPLVFSGPVLADIFRGRISAWNDPAIAKLNPDVRLPDAGITVVHRADGSGTTYVFTDYLCKVSPEFAKNPGKGTTVNWPAEDKIGAKGSEGMPGVVAKTSGAIGYVELTYAIRGKIEYGTVVNAAGKPVHARLESVTAAASSFAHPPADLRMSITNPSGEEAYPIAAFSYLLVYKNQPDPAKADALADFLTWAVTDGQRLAPALGYAPLPAEIVARDHHQILSLSVNGKPFAALR
ncbi:MAG TPA: phosphate ABC transporter substrate-binding protein PstS, partial [Tepidisphaeraceae bacterium]